MKGRKPLPTKVHELNGNPSKLRLDKRNEPQPRVGDIFCPDWLDEEARKVWERNAPELIRLGTLTIIDQDAFAAYCQVYSRWKRAERAIQDSFSYEFTDKDFKTKRADKPEVRIARDAWNQVKAMEAEFGMTPSSRSRIIASPEKPKDPIAEMLEGSHKN